MVNYLQTLFKKSEKKKQKVHSSFLSNMFGLFWDFAPRMAFRFLLHNPGSERTKKVTRNTF